MSPDWNEVLAFWGVENLLTIPGSAIPNLALPDPTKEFLEQVGVVRASRRLKESLGITFGLGPNRSLIRLDQHFEGDVPKAMRSWTLIGHCFERLLCIESVRGQVITLDGTPDSGFLKWFLNSSLPQLMFFVTKILQSFNRSAKRKNQASWIPELVELLKRADGDAFKKATNWWPTFLHEVEDGML
jgi:hypothetical protein